MNLQQLRVQIDRRTGMAQAVPAANAFINEALAIISQERDWPWLDATETVTITAATEYDLPADHVETRGVNFNGTELRYINIADGDTYNSEGIFPSYSLEGGKLIFYPQLPEGETVTHRYLRSEPLLSADNDTPLMPERYHSLICDLAASMFLEARKPKRAEYYRDLYNKGQRKMYSATQRRVNPARARIRPGGWY